MVKRRGQKTLCLGRRIDTPVSQKRCENRAALKMGAKAIDGLGFRLKNIPFFHRKGI